MGLVYKRSTKNAAKRYERTSGVVPNVGVASLAVINPGSYKAIAWGRHGQRRWYVRAPNGNVRIYGTKDEAERKASSLAKRYQIRRRRQDRTAGGAVRRNRRSTVRRRTSRASRRTSRTPRRRRGRTSKNPYQWVEGVTDKRGRRRRKLPTRTTPVYKTQDYARGLGSRRATERSRLYIVDDFGNIMCPAGREKSMKRNRGSVRRNDVVTDAAIIAAAGLAARPKKKKKAKTSRRAVSRTRQKTTKRKTTKRAPKRKTTKRKRRRPTAKLGRKTIYLTGIPEIDRQLKAGRMPVMVQVPKKGKKGRPRTTAFASSRYTGSMRRLHKRVTKPRPRYRRKKEPVEVTWWAGEDFESMTKKQLEAYAAGEGLYLPADALTKEEMIAELEAATGAGGFVGVGRQWGGWVRANKGRKRRKKRRSSKRRTSRRARSRTSRRRSSKRTSKRRASRRRTTRRNGRHRSSKRRTTRNGRRRSSRRRSSKRRTSRGRRSSRRRSSRRTSRRGRTYGVRVLNNPRAIMPRRRRKGKKRAGHSLYQVTPIGPKTSKRRKSRSIPVLLAPQIVEYAEVRRIKPGRRKKKKTSMAANGRRRRTSMRKNARRRTTRRNRTTANKRRRGRRRSSKRRSSKRRYTRRRRVRRNQGMGMAALRPRALWRDVGIPVIGGGVGFVAARAAGSAAQMIAPLQQAVGDPWARAIGNTVGILGTLALSAQVKMIRQNRGPLVVGMGIALLDNMIQALGGEGGPLAFLSGRNDVYSAGLLGAYVDVANAGSPYRGMMGEYVEYTPVAGGPGVGAYVTTGQDQMMGEYVEQGVSGMGSAYAEGIDPADARTIESMIDGAEMQAAAGLYEAAAGVGQVYEAAAGVGQVYEALAAAPAWRGPTFGSRMTAFRRQQVPEVSTITPPMPARPITADLPTELPITESIATPEGRGHAGGIFGANLFAPMASC